MSELGELAAVARRLPAVEALATLEAHLQHGRVVALHHSLHYCSSTPYRIPDTGYRNDYDSVHLIYSVIPF